MLPGSRFYEQREKLQFKFNSTTPFQVIETPDFSIQDLEIANKLAMGFEIFTYYFPAIADYFYSTLDPAITPVNRIEKWMDQVERIIGPVFYRPDKSFVEEGTSSVTRWNLLKGGILKEVSQAKLAYTIYSVIYQLEKDQYPEAIEKTISLGMRIYQYFYENSIMPQREKIPDEIIDGIDSKLINGILNRFKDRN